MKGLTIEEKAKRYGEALERAKKLQETCDSTAVVGWCEYIFPELKESEEENVRKVLVGYFKSYKEIGTIGAETFNGIPTDNIIAWLEKQGEQPTDKVEPKFKVGDWVVYDHRPYQVVELPKEGYINLGLRRNGKVEFAPSPYCRHWTIADAKDGDVLFHSDSASNGIFVFKEILQRGTIQKVVCYCDYDSEDGFCLGENHTCCWTDSKILHPATKEQRDLLFAKMKEAGYEFDGDKKELKRIEQKPLDNVEPKFKADNYIVLVLP